MWFTSLKNPSTTVIFWAGAFSPFVNAELPGCIATRGNMPQLPNVLPPGHAPSNKNKNGLENQKTCKKNVEVKFCWFFHFFPTSPRCFNQKPKPAVSPTLAPAPLQNLVAAGELMEAKYWSAISPRPAMASTIPSRNAKKKSPKINCSLKLFVWPLELFWPKKRFCWIIPVLLDGFIFKKKKKHIKTPMFASFAQKKRQKEKELTLDKFFGFWSVPHHSASDWLQAQVANHPGKHGVWGGNCGISLWKDPDCSAYCHHTDLKKGMVLLGSYPCWLLHCQNKLLRDLASRRSSAWSLAFWVPVEFWAAWVFNRYIAEPKYLPRGKKDAANMCWTRTCVTKRKTKYPQLLRNLN